MPNKLRYDFNHTGRAMYAYTWLTVPEGVNPSAFARPSPEVDAQLPPEVRGRLWLLLPFNQEPWMVLLAEPEEVLPVGFAARYGHEPHPDEYHGDPYSGLDRSDFKVAQNLYRQGREKWDGAGPPDWPDSDQIAWEISSEESVAHGLGQPASYRLHGDDRGSGWRVHFPDSGVPTVDYALGEGDKGGFIDHPRYFFAGVLHRLTRAGIVISVDALALYGVAKGGVTPPWVLAAQQRLYRSKFPILGREKARKAVD